MLEYDWSESELRIIDPDMVSFIADIYRESRYLEKIPDKALHLRLNGLVAELVTLDFSGSPHFQFVNGRESIAFIEVIEELKIRNRDVEKLVAESLHRFVAKFKKSNLYTIQQQVEQISGKKCLFKFTKKNYVNDILSGKVRFKSASSYNNEGYNISIRDDELNVDHILKNLRLTTEEGAVIPVIGDKISASAAGDYYISCFSVTFDLKMFFLFDYDSCVAISNGDTFVETVKTQYQKKYPNFFINFGQVEYIDIYRQLKSKRPIEFRKSRDFLFEKEFRFVSFPVVSAEMLEPLQIVEIDSSRIDYCVMEIE